MTSSSTDICIIEECSNTVEARGLCAKDYAYHKRQGDLDAVALPSSRRQKAARVCDVLECTSLVHARDLCYRHYAQWRKLGSFAFEDSFGPRTSDDPKFAVKSPAQMSLDELYARGSVFEDSSGCHIWTRAMSRSGYGSTSVVLDGKSLTVGAHALAAAIKYDLPLQQGHSWEARHLCHKPACIRTDEKHVVPGSSQQNRRDGSGRDEIEDYNCDGSWKPTWDETYMKMAEIYAQTSLCEERAVGAIIADSKQYFRGAGVNGTGKLISPDDCYTCFEFCPARRDQRLPCVAAHAEVNAMAFVAPEHLANGTIYLSCAPCQACANALLVSGLTRLVCWVTLRDHTHKAPLKVLDFLMSGGMNVELLYLSPYLREKLWGEI